LNRMGSVYWAQNKIMEARHYFERAVVNDGDHPEHLKNLADAYLAEEKFEEGIQILMALMQKFPDDFEAYEKMANLYIENGNYDSARELIERFREKQPGHAYAGSMLELIQYPEVYIAYQFLNQGELDTAENLFRDYLTHTQDCLPAKLGLGSIIFHKEQYKEAEKIYAEILTHSKGFRRSGD
ncbi:MAG: tetratricopeptide repeat protein, partial [Calditrichia bacterium]